MLLAAERPLPLTAARRDSLGCSLGGLAQDLQLAGQGSTFFRKRKDDPALSQVFTPASDRGFLVGISMQAGHRRRILRDGRASTHEFDAGTVYVRDFNDDFRADLSGSFDFLLLELSRASFERASDERGGRRVHGLECVIGTHDAVLSHLGRALAAAMERPQEASPLFVDQMSVAFSTYLVEHYGGPVAAPRPARRRLSHQHGQRAKEMLRSHIEGDISIAEIAQACQLSRSYFIRAFRETTGQTPLQWLLSQRIARARCLLIDSALPLAHIATACGFADQSHFTRVFTQAEGQPPGSWRRQAGRPQAAASSPGHAG